MQTYSQCQPTATHTFRSRHHHEAQLISRKKSDQSPAMDARLSAAFAFLPLGGSSALGEDPPASDGWISLFNGKDLDGWIPKIRGYEAGDNFGNTFRVENGVLKVAYDQYSKFDGKFGHLFYKTPFSHYKLHVEYRFVGEQCPGGPSWAFRNSGVMIHGQSPESMRKDQDFPVSIEVQFLGATQTAKAAARPQTCARPAQTSS